MQTLKKLTSARLNVRLGLTVHTFKRKIEYTKNTRVMPGRVNRLTDNRYKSMTIDINRRLISITDRNRQQFIHRLESIIIDCCRIFFCPLQVMLINFLTKLVYKGFNERVDCQRASRAKTQGWRGGSIIGPCESTVQAEKS